MIQNQNFVSLCRMRGFSLAKNFLSWQHPNVTQWYFTPHFVKPFHDSFIILECLSTCPVCILQHGTYILCLLELISAFDFTTHFFKFHEQAKKMNGRVCTKKVQLYVYRTHQISRCHRLSWSRKFLFFTNVPAPVCT